MVAVRRYDGLVWRIAASAAVAALMVAWAAGAIIGVDQRHKAASTMDTLDFTAAFLMLGFVIVLLPLGSWVVLRLLGISWASLVVLVGWTVSLCTVVAVHGMVAGGTKPAWVYALCAAVGYGLAGLVTHQRFIAQIGHVVERLIARL